MKQTMRGSSIIIYGFDYKTTERIINAYTVGMTDFSAAYINAGAHREDRLLCHLKLGTDIVNPYILNGMADVIHTGSWADAGRYLEWIRENGTVRVEEGTSDVAAERQSAVTEEDTDNRRMKEFILRQEKSGLIKVVYTARNVL